MPSPNKHRTRAVKYDKVAQRAHIKTKYLGWLELLYGHRKYKRASKAIERGAACVTEQQAQTSCLPVESRLTPPKFWLGKSFPLYNHLSYSCLDLLLVKLLGLGRWYTCKDTYPVQCYCDRISRLNFSSRSHGQKRASVRPSHHSSHHFTSSPTVLAKETIIINHHSIAHSHNPKALPSYSDPFQWI